MEDMQLEELVRASRNGDKESFGQIVSACQGRVCSVAYAITGSIELSEDLAQEAFLAAWRGLPDLRELDKFPAWVCGIVRNLARKTLRRHGRDALDRSQALVAEPVDRTDDVSDQLDRQACESIVWKSLETIPETYREPLVIFYRESGSIRSIAEALDITEDAAKQRLSRGRQMLKAQVTALVESTLEKTRPGTAFTLAVLAGLPTLSSQALAAGTAASAASKSAASGGATSAIATGAAVGVLGGLLGTLIGMTGGFFGMWASIRNSQTLRTRRYSLKMCGVVYAFVWLFMGLLAGGIAGFWDNAQLRSIWLTACWIGYAPALLSIIVVGNRTYARIRAEDRGETSRPTVPLEESTLSLDCLRRWFRWSLLLAILGSAASMAWLAVIPNRQAYWLPAAGVLLLCHVMFVQVYVRGLRTAIDQAAFEATPPLIREEPGEAPAFVYYRSETTILGLPLVSIGAERDEQTGKEGPCRGIVAIGNRPVGIVAIGRTPVGVFAVGAVATGVFSLGGVAIGVAGLGGVAIGIALAVGGVAIGGIAIGGYAIGYYALGPDYSLSRPLGT